MRCASFSGEPTFLASPERRRLIQLAACSAAVGAGATWADQPIDVALAGMAFSGDAASLKTRFPYSLGYQASLKAAGRFPAKMLFEAVGPTSTDKLRFVPRLDELKGRDQAVAVALVVGSETISVEKLAGLNKLFVLIRAQALFFDFKSMSVLRAYPISFAQIDVFDRTPTAAEVAERVRGVYEGAGGKPGIFTRFGYALAKASLPAQTSRTLGVSKIVIKPESTSSIPDYLTSSPTVAETWAADLVGEALSTRALVPIVPYAKGYAVGNVMSVSIADGDVYNLKLPKPDYEISVEFTRLVKKKFGESAAGASYIYGLVSTMRIEEPVSGKVYLNAELKNGETKLVPATQTYVDDFPAYYDAINGLFVKLSETVAGGDTKWIKSAAVAPDIDKQIADTRELVKLCK